MNPLIELRDALRVFARERDWEQFHSPRNLATAMAVEAAELLEHFQWQTSEHAGALPATRCGDPSRDGGRAPLLVRLADRLDVDLAEAARDKLAINAAKYPRTRRAEGRTSTTSSDPCGASPDIVMSRSTPETTIWAPVSRPMSSLRHGAALFRSSYGGSLSCRDQPVMRLLPREGMNRVVDERPYLGRQVAVARKQRMNRNGGRMPVGQYSRQLGEDRAALATSAGSCAMPKP